MFPSSEKLIKMPSRSAPKNPKIAVQKIGIKSTKTSTIFRALML
jgi:hypothetical protein